MLESTTLPQARYKAQTLVDGGESAQAQAVLEHAVEQGKAGLADGDAELLSTMRQLAALHARLDDPTSARRLLEEAMVGAQRRADTDSLRLMLTYDLAVVAEELANRHEARTNFARVAEFGPAALGADHWAVTNARTYLENGTLPPSSAVPLSSAVLPSPTELAVPAVPAFSPAPLLSSRASSGAPSRPRQWWVIAGAGLVAALVVVGVLVLRPDSSTDTALVAAGPTTAAASLPPAVLAPTPTPAGTTRASTAPTTTAAAPTTATAEPSATTRPATVPPAVTRIVSPANGGSATWSFQARFTLSPADKAANGTVLALSLCVSGRCYLDGEVSGAPYAIRLGSSAGEGAGLAWQLRVDRFSDAAFAALMAERDQEIADSTWGEKGTSLSGLNKTPVSAVTVTKKG